MRENNNQFFGLHHSIENAKNSKNAKVDKVLNIDFIESVLNIGDDTKVDENDNQYLWLLNLKKLENERV